MDNAKPFAFQGPLEHQESAYLTDEVNWPELAEENRHIFMSHEDEEAIITTEGQSVQICQDHWQRIGQLMNWSMPE